MFAEVYPAHIRILDNLLRRSLCQHCAIADDERVVTDAQCFAHIVISNQDANAALLEEADDALNLDHGDGQYRQTAHPAG